MKSSINIIYLDAIVPVDF